jgi:hypothetical protein
MPMLITQFRKYTPLNILWVSVVGLILCLGVFAFLPDKVETSLFEPSLARIMGDWSTIQVAPSLNVLITLILTIIQALWLNRVSNAYNLFGRPSFLTALMYMTLASLHLPFLLLTPILLCNFISIWMLSKLLSLYATQDVRAILFDLGMLVALGSLIYFPFILMVLLVWASLSIFRPFYWKEWVIPVVGLASVYFVLGVIYFWIDRMQEFYNIWSPFIAPVSPYLQIDSYDYLVFLPVLLILILFVFVLQKTFFKSIVHIRKTFQLLFMMLLIAVLSVFISYDHKIVHFLLVAPVLSIYMGYYFQFSEKKWFFESVYAFLVLTILYFQFN